MDQPATRSAEAVFAPAMTIALTIAPRTATLRALEDILFLRGVEPQTGRFVTQDEHAGTVVTAWGTRRGLGTKDLGRRTKDEGRRTLDVGRWTKDLENTLGTGTFAHSGQAHLHRHRTAPNKTRLTRAPNAKTRRQPHFRRKPLKPKESDAINLLPIRAKSTRTSETNCKKHNLNGVISETSRRAPPNARPS